MPDWRGFSAYSLSLPSRVFSPYPLTGEGWGEGEGSLARLRLTLAIARFFS